MSMEKSSEIGGESKFRYINLYRSLVKGDLEGVKAFLDRDPDAISAQISTRGETPIHIAVSHGHKDLANELLTRKMKKDQSTSGKTTSSGKDDCGDTPLHIVARGSNKAIANSLVHRSPSLVAEPDADGQLPLTLAAIFGNLDLKVQVLDIAMHHSADGQDRIIFTGFIKSKNFGLAERMWKRGESELMFFKDDLFIMAEMASVFSCANQLTSFGRWMYYSECMRKLYSSLKKDMDAMNVFAHSESPLSKSKHFIKVRRFLKGLMLSFVKAIGIEETLNMRLKNRQALGLLSKMCSPIWTFDLKYVEVYFEAITRAIKCGNVVFVEEVLRSNPALMWGYKESGTIFHIAVAFRQEKIWNLIYGLNTEHRNKVLGTLFKSNSLLHIAASPMVMSETIGDDQDEASEKLMEGEQQFWKTFSEAPGAAMKVQREFQWYKEVERMVPSSYRILANKNRKTPPTLFSNLHSELVKEGEKWMRDTATSCTIVATLIVTIVFAAALTLPGGLDDKTGVPNYLQQSAFMVFIIADALSLFSSVTAVLMFLSILTSRFEEKDFLRALPKRLIIGFASLFFSMATMMVTFVATIVIVLDTKISWAYAPATALASVPVTLFVLLQFPLFVDMVSATYGRGMFNRKTKCSFFNNPNDYVPEKLKGSN